ncbi:hypothetical protein J4729_22930 [Leisingera sp. HS039]|uniref:hypothetical protein n=1 Tax=unclassified Leisingera TaxID=2614906 RepID=UPI001070B0F9|nr:MULTISPECIES: hypothetical protein [unclassified Leisingera]MBQ4827373.1 hypothetical protein [Leisingera sp. HS039]QBR37661.1 hypothetical protein ETW23_17620 [Leisingera sp. NJS201]
MTPALRHITRDEISARLSHAALLSPVRQAMIACSTGKAAAAAHNECPWNCAYWAIGKRQDNRDV